jgi:hypothetical protein
MALEYVSKQLRGDKEVVLAAVYNCGFALRYACDELFKDKLFLIECYRNRNRNRNRNNNNINNSNYFYIYVNDKRYNSNESLLLNNFIEQFDQLENGHFDDTFIEKNVDILDLVENKEQLCEYLLKNNKYRTIYDNDNIAEYIKDKYKIVILSLDEITPPKDN